MFGPIMILWTLRSALRGIHPPPLAVLDKPEAEAAVHDIVKQLEMTGIVRQCSSTATLPCVPVPKPNEIGICALVISDVTTVDKS